MRRVMVGLALSACALLGSPVKAFDSPPNAHPPDARVAGRQDVVGPRGETKIVVSWSAWDDSPGVETRLVMVEGDTSRPLTDWLAGEAQELSIALRPTSAAWPDVQTLIMQTEARDAAGQTAFGGPSSFRVIWIDDRQAKAFGAWIRAAGSPFVRRTVSSAIDGRARSLRFMLPPGTTSFAVVAVTGPKEGRAEFDNQRFARRKTLSAPSLRLRAIVDVRTYDFYPLDAREYWITRLRGRVRIDGVVAVVDRGRCDVSYPGPCIPSPPPKLNCADIRFRNFVVLPPDPHGFDHDSDGIGCETR